MNLYFQLTNQIAGGCLDGFKVYGEKYYITDEFQPFVPLIYLTGKTAPTCKIM